MLLCGLDMVKQYKITKVLVMGYSKQVIHKMTAGYNQGAVKIRIIYEQVRQTSANLQTVFYHILKSNNTEAHNLANQGAKLKVGLSIVKGHLKNLIYVP